MRSDLMPCRGTSLRVRQAGLADLPTVLFVNAVGMRGSLLDGPAAIFAAAGLNLVTWELRGSPGPEDARAVTLDDHVADAVEILGILGAGKAHIAGWCTGASIALHLTRRLGDQVLSFASVDGAYLFDGVPGGPLGNAMFGMCKQIVSDESRADYFHDITKPRGNEATVLGLEGRPELVDQLILPYRGGVGGLIAYAYAIHRSCSYDPAELCQALAVPTLILARRDDRMVASKNSMRAASLVAGAQLSIADSGGHYALFIEDQIAREIAEFMLAAGRGSRTGGPGHR